MLTASNDLAQRCRTAARESGELAVKFIHLGWIYPAYQMTKTAAHLAYIALDLEKGDLRLVPWRVFGS